MGSQQLPWQGQAEMQVGDTRWSSLFLVPQPCRPLKPLKAPLPTFTEKEMVCPLCGFSRPKAHTDDGHGRGSGQTNGSGPKRTEEPKQTEVQGLTFALFVGVETNNLEPRIKN